MCGLKTRKSGITIVVVTLWVLFSGALVVQRVGADYVETDVDWDVVRGNSKSNVAFFVQQTSDGGYVVTGYWEGLNENDTDVFLEKIDSEGNFLWGKIYGTFGHDVGYCVQQTKDGGYIIGGYAEPVGQGGNNFYIIKTDSEGNLLWTQNPDDPEDDGTCYAIQQTDDGGYIFVGYIDLFDEDGKDVHLVKTDSDGHRIWSYAYGGVGEDVGRSVKQTSDGGYIVAGWTSSLGAGDQNVYLFKTDSDGIKTWGLAFGIEGNEDAGYSVQQTSDGGYIVVGYTDFGMDRDVYLAKIDPHGEVLWGYAIGGVNEDVGRSVWQDVDGGYIITGHTESFEGGKDVYLLKTDSEGNKLWDIVVGGTDDDAGYSVQPTSDGGYIVAGYTGSIDEGEADSYLIKFQSTIIEEVEIGVIFPIEEAQETLGPMVDMAEEDINDYMERNNHSYRFEFLIENAEGQVDVHLEKVQEFKSMGVDLIIGGASSSQAQGSLSYVNQNDMLLLSHGSNNPALGIPDDNLFRLCPTVLYQTRAIAKMLRSYGIEACVVIQRADTVVDDIYTAFQEEYEDLGGTVLGRIRYDVGTIDFGEYLQSAENIAAQAVEERGQHRVAVEVLGLDEVARMAAQASDFPTLYGCKWFGYSGTALADRILSDAPEEADHLKIFSPIIVPPDTQQYQSLYDRYSSVMDRGPNFFEAAFYDACWLYALTVVEADSADAMEVKAQLLLLASKHEGVSGEMDLNEEGDRESVNFDILGCSLENGEAKRVKYGYYDGKTGQVVWEMALNREPTADADGPYSGVVGDPISFSSTGSSDPDGTIQEYRWDFGDGSAPSYSQYPMHPYSAAETYTVILRVTDDDGASAKYTTSCTVSEPEATGTAWSIERIATLITIGGATVGVVGWMFKTRSERRRRVILYKELIQGVDSIYTRYKMNARQCEAELFRFKEQVISELKQGMITEENYNILDGRIEEYLAEIREEILGERSEEPRS